MGGRWPADRGPQDRAAASAAVLTPRSTAILVDVVVRDGRGRPVTDLTAADFEIAEDGVRQTIDSFSRVSRGGGIGVGVAWRLAAADRGHQPDGRRRRDHGPSRPSEATTALVFDHLSAESLRLAQQATLAYVPMSGESSAQVGVFATDPRRPGRAAVYDRPRG